MRAHGAVLRSLTGHVVPRCPSSRPAAQSLFACACKVTAIRTCTTFRWTLYSVKCVPERARGERAEVRDQGVRVEGAGKLGLGVGGLAISLTTEHSSGSLPPDWHQVIYGLYVENIMTSPESPPPHPPAALVPHPFSSQAAQCDGSAYLLLVLATPRARFQTQYR